MTRRSFWRPENALLLAVLLLGVDILFATLFLLGAFGVARWYGAVLLVPGAIMALVVLSYGRMRRREQRPEWLETQAWRKGLSEKLHQGESLQETPPPDEPKVE